MPNDRKKRKKAPPLPDKPSEYPVGHPLGQQSFDEFYQIIVERSKNKAPQSLERKNPQLAADVLWRLAQGKSRLSISRDLGLDMPTLRRLLEDNEQAIEAKRKEMAYVFAGVANQYVGLLQKKADLLDDDDDALHRRRVLRDEQRRCCDACP